MDFLALRLDFSLEYIRIKKRYELISQYICIRKTIRSNIQICIYQKIIRTNIQIWLYQKNHTNMIQTNISIRKYSNIQIFVTPWSGYSGKSGDSVVDRPTQLICISDIYLLSWRWRPPWSLGTLYQWSLQPKKAS